MTQVLDGETITREYIIHVPSGYQEGDNLPLVVVYHGFGGCSYYMQEEAGNGALNDLADEEGFFVAYPQAAYRPAKEDVYWEPGFNGGESIYQTTSTSPSRCWATSTMSFQWICRASMQQGTAMVEC